MDIDRRRFFLCRTATSAIRPPWSGLEDDFTARCNRCGACERACPTGVIKKHAGGFPRMAFGEQGRRAVVNHERARVEKPTCIDCHKGVAHRRPPTEQNIGAPKVLSASQ